MVIFRLYAPIEASNFSKVKEGRRLAYPTTGSLVLRAKDRLRLFRKLFKKVLSKTSFFGQAFFLKERLRVNSTGGILTLLLTKQRGTVHLGMKFRGIPSAYSF
jgi:hypothetical protein